MTQIIKHIPEGKWFTEERIVVTKLPPHVLTHPQTKLFQKNKQMRAWRSQLLIIGQKQLISATRRN